MDRAVHSGDSSATGRKDFCIVGAAASSAGLEALQKLFQAMPRDRGMVFVVVLRHHSEFKSSDLEPLLHSANMPIHLAADGIALEPNAIYLVPPGQEMTLSGGKLFSVSTASSEGLSIRSILQVNTSQESDLGQIIQFSLGQLEEELAGSSTGTALLSESTTKRIQALEQELRETKRNVQAAVAELESGNEKLQSTNNHLHFVNEQLAAVIAEHQNRILELTELTQNVEYLLDSSEAYSLFLDCNLCVQKFTPKMAKVFHLVPQDIGREIASFSHSIDCEDLAEQAAEVLESGKMFEQRVHEDCDQKFLMRLIPYESASARKGVVLTLVDITTLVAAEYEAFRERERFERALLANRDGIWDWPDVSIERMWWSDTCYQLLGFEPGEFPSTYSEWMNLIHPEDRELVLQTSIPSQENCFVELHRQFEYRMRTSSGDYRWFEHRAIVDHDGQGKPYRMTGSVADIHDRKCAEMHSVEEIDLRDNFLAMLSHELRNPMGAVLNSIESAKLPADNASTDPVDESKSLEAAQEAMRIIGRQTKHMARLLDDLLDVARFGQNKIEFRQEVVDLTLLAEEVLEAFSHELSNKHHELHVDLGNSPIFVVADPTRMKQAQINLLSNAAKYTPEGGDLWYEIHQESGTAIITIRDTGDGIPAHMLDSIFDLFVQSKSNSAHSSGGIGVGLSLARNIVQAHHGTIQVESEGEGQGSTFTIQIPITSSVKTPVVAAPHFSVDNRSLLLVEDNEDARTMLAKSLRMQGFTVHEASDGFSALEMFQQFKPDIAIVDIGLPVMDGYQFARAVRQLDVDWHFLLVALTGYGRDADREQALSAGFDAHLVKPLDPAELYRTLSTNHTTGHTP